ncbi:hypothetical protein W03_13250 [Nitrosomonas sp. PY1]|uniref:glycoside hydrolase n=1 Tax=Nitrosomonas sp. PY1 TaxID=1803906 RepID=UPI001FC85455|nr:glycoside hydrolase [Nitrosomonas sp. PY1]GKS69321.1 hypothetical protein W03_13250 [Nitrosomonas sp. PY1]
MKTNFEFPSTIPLAMAPYGSGSNYKLKAAFIAIFIFIVFIVLFSSGIIHAADGVKWHPGHYYQLLGGAKNNPKFMMDAVYKDLVNTPALRGIQVRYMWGDIETAKGQYNFASIDKHLAELQKRNKRLVIMIQTKSFSANSVTYVPPYLRSVEYDGGVFTFSGSGPNKPTGENLKLWNPLVRDRLSELFRALGKRYNAHPYFEGIGMSETALGAPLNPVTGTQTNDFYKNLHMVLQEARKAFPNTMVMQSVNYPRPIIAPLVETLKKMGGGLSHPDTYLEERGLLMEGTKYTPPGVYTHYPKLSGIIPLAPTVMHHNYANTKSDSSGYKPTVSELLDFLRDDLKANYIFWTRDPKYYQGVLEMLNWSAQKDKDAGGLSTTCPSTYSSCVQ